MDKQSERPHRQVESADSTALASLFFRLDLASCERVGFVGCKLSGRTSIAIRDSRTVAESARQRNLLLFINFH